jgi:IS5 family transposase
MKQTSFSDAEFASKKKLTRRERFLAEIEAATPWPALVAALLPYYPKGDGRGRPPMGLERMLRMYIAQQCFGLSDEGIEDAIYDSQSIRGFVGIDLTLESVPDATTLLKFRRLLEKHNLTRRIFDEINVHLASKGLMMREGTIREKLEKAKPRVRAKVDHCFLVVKCLFKHGKTRYRGLVKNNAQLFTLFGFANLVLARGFLGKAYAQVAS